MKEEVIKETISALGFVATEPQGKIYLKTYGTENYKISVDFNHESIDYGSQIKKGDETTSHLETPENLVVLECVDRLIEKGYKPQDITLEKKWKLGRSAKGGKADITIKGKDGKTLIIIECKTWGVEYEKELGRMRQNGGQLFSYFQQDKNARYLCLYTSRFFEGYIEKEYVLINVEDKTEERVKQRKSSKTITYEHAKTVKEMVEVWKHKTNGKQIFLDTGLFENDVEAYNPGYIPLKIGDLKDFTRDDKGRVYNQFEEILRHNNISDRSNAFNRVISLILTKIVDENKVDRCIADFQIKDGVDDAESLLERLQSLYSKAMKDYLNEEVIDYKLEDIEREIENFPRQTAKDTLYRIYKELKFYQNNEFAFKEVYNKKLFEENAQVLEEIVRLFQGYRFRYDQKAQFLGDFFELMLESGYKQTEGQFFTPTPIAKFIISSIPVKSIIKEKIQKGKRQFLPMVIDFACGSGHFLTEAIAEINDEIQIINDEEIEGDELKATIERYKKDMRWAKEYIYGIEKDYRLARTSQVACFMHGDGDANIIFGDGLARHNRLPEDGSFDILIANPPYTIKDFKKHLKINPHDFEMWENVSPESDDIELFFVERMKQLLRPGGMAGIILPSSILNNAGPYTKAREILLKYFEFKAIVEFGGSTFSATSTNTVVLFLKRRHEDFDTNCRYIAEDFIAENIERKGDFLNSEELFDNYVHHIGLNMEDYETFLARNPNETIMTSNFYKNYENWFRNLPSVRNVRKKKAFMVLKESEQQKRLRLMFFDIVLELETEKFYYYLLTHRIEPDPEHFGLFRDKAEDGSPLIVVYPQKKAVPQTTLIVKSGRTVKEQEAFLGYKFSNRRGYQGIDFTGETMLYDENDRFNHEKVNGYIYRTLSEEIEDTFEIENERLTQIDLKDSINFDRIDFDKRININGIHIQQIYSYYNTGYEQSLGEVSIIQKGTSITMEETSEGAIPVIAGGQEPAYFHNKSNREPDVITISASGAYAGYIGFWREPIFASDCITVKSKDEKSISTYLIYNYLKAIQSEIYRLQRGQAQPHVYPKDIAKIRIPIPPLKTQNKIIKELKIVDEHKKQALTQIDNIENQIYKSIQSDSSFREISEVALISSLKTNPLDAPNDFHNYIGLEHIESNTGRISDWKPTLGYNLKSAKNVFKTNQVLFGKLRPYLNKVAVPDFDGICSTDILVLNTDFPDILKRILLSKEFVEKSTNLMQGVNLPRIKVKDFMKMKIRFPNKPLHINKIITSLESEIKEFEKSIMDFDVKKKEILTNYLVK